MIGTGIFAGVVVLVGLAIKGLALFAIVYGGARLAIRHERSISR